MNKKHLLEMLAMFLIGDGVVLAMDSERHLRLWEGADPIPGIVEAFLRYPRLSRVVGLAAAAGGLWWVSRLKPTTRAAGLRRGLGLR
jgi:hypothetical protein